jgi:CRP-like cAMP-binding protein
MLLTHQDIANFTASSRQTTSTVIGDLAKEGKVVYEDRKTIFIPDITKLK